MTRIFKKIKLSLMLAVAGVTALSAASGSEPLGAKAGEEKFTYVSLGDSMTTGFGFNDYYVDDDPLAETVGVDYKSESGHKNVRGFLVNASESYPALIRDELAQEYGYDNVDWIQLASNAARIDDIYYDLTGDTERDEYFGCVMDSDADGEAWNSIWGERARDYGYATSENGNEAVTEAYVAAIQAADLITLNAGFNNFGCFLTGKLSSFIESDMFDGPAGSFIQNFGGHDTLQAFVDRVGLNFNVDDVYDFAYTVVEKELGLDLRQYEDIVIPGFGTVHARLILDTTILAFVSYCYYMNETTKAIRAINPDAELIVIGLTNSIEGMKFSLGDKIIPVDTLFGYLFRAANLYTALGTEMADTYKYVDVEGLDVALHIDNLAENSMDESEEDRTYEAVYEIGAMFGIGEYLPLITKEELYGDLPIYNPIKMAQIAAVKAILLDLQRAAGNGVVSIDQIIGNFATISEASPGDLSEALAEGEFDSLLHLYIRVVLSNGMWNHPSAEGHRALADAVMYTRKTAPSAREYALDLLVGMILNIKEQLMPELNELIGNARAAGKAYVQSKVDAAKAIAFEALDNIDLFFEGRINEGLSHIGGEINEYLDLLEGTINEILGAVGGAVDAVKDSIEYAEGKVIASVDYAKAKVDEGIAHIQQKVDEIELMIRMTMTAVRTYLENKINGAIAFANQKVAEGLRHLSEKLVVVTKFLVVAIRKAEIAALDAIAYVAGLPAEYHEEFGYVVAVYDICDFQPELALEAVQNAIDQIIPTIVGYATEAYVELSTILETAQYQMTVAQYNAVRGFKMAIFGAIIKLGHVNDKFIEEHGREVAQFIYTVASRLDRRLVWMIAEANQDHKAALVGHLMDLAQKLRVVMELAGQEDAVVSHTFSELNEALSEAMSDLFRFVDWVKANKEEVAEHIIDEFMMVTEAVAVIFPHHYAEDYGYYAQDQWGKYHICDVCGWREYCYAGDIDYDWQLGEEGWTCTATATFEDGDVLVETGDVTFEVTKYPNIKEGGLGETTYTATFEHIPAGTQTLQDVTYDDVEYKWSGVEACTASVQLYSSGFESEFVELEGEISSEELHEAQYLEIAPLTVQYTARFYEKKQQLLKGLRLGTSDRKEIVPENIKIESYFVVKDSVSYVWSQDGSSVTAKGVLTNGEEYEEYASIAEGTVSVIDLAGDMKQYVASFAHFDSNTINIEVAVTTEWADDYSSCTATIDFIGKNYTITETASIDDEQISVEMFDAPTATTKGTSVYTAFFAHCAPVVSEPVEDLTLENITYSWAEDYSWCIAYGDIICNGLYVVEIDYAELGEIESEIVDLPTLDEVGHVSHVAYFDSFEANEEIEILPLVEVMSVSYVWNGYGECKAILGLSNGTTVVEDAEIEYFVDTEPTLDDEGVGVYVASFDHVEPDYRFVPIAQLTFNPEDVEYYAYDYFAEMDVSSYAFYDFICDAYVTLSNGELYYEESEVWFYDDGCEYVPGSFEEMGAYVVTFEFDRFESYTASFETAYAEVYEDLGNNWYVDDFGNLACSHTVLLADFVAQELCGEYTEDAWVTAEVIQEATLDQAGIVEYTASFDSFEDASFQITTDKLEIIACEYIWKDDLTDCAAILMLSDGSMVTEYANDITKEVTTAPTFTDMGTTTYTATFAHADAVSTELQDVAKLFVVTNEDGTHYTTEANLANGVKLDLITTADGASISTDDYTISFDANAVNSVSDNTELFVRTNETDDQYSIELMLKDGAWTETFNGEVTITIDYDKEVKEGHVVKVYYVDGDKLEDMHATLKDGKLTFKTTHFSTYIVVDEEIPAPVEAPTGLGLWWIAIAAVALALCLALVYIFIMKPRKAKNK